MNNFTPRAQQILVLARKESDRLGHHHVGPEHLLLGMVKLGQGVAVNVLERMGLDLEDLKRQAERELGEGPGGPPPGHRPYSTGVKKILEAARKEAKSLHHSYVGTEHLLLGILRHNSSGASRVLGRLDVEVQRTRNEVLAEIDPSFSPDDEEDEDDEDQGNYAQDKHPLVQRQLWVIEQINAEKVRAIADQDFAHAAALRDAEKNAMKDLEAIRKRIAMEPLWGLRRSQAVELYGMQVGYLVGGCHRSKERNLIVETLSRGGSVVLIAERGSGRRALGESVAADLMSLSRNSPWLYAYTPNHIALRQSGLDGEYEQSLELLVNGLVQDRSGALFIPDIHLLAGEGPRNREMVDSWSRALPTLLDEGIPLLVWTEPEQVESLRKIWPSLLSRSLAVTLSPLGPEEITSLLLEEAGRLSEHHFVDIDPEIIPLIQGSRSGCTPCDMAEPHASIELLRRSVFEHVAEHAATFMDLPPEKIFDKIIELEEAIRDSVGKRDFLRANDHKAEIDRIIRHAASRANAVPERLKLSVEIVKKILNI